MLQVLSLGAGVQSSTLALMSAVGDLPALDAAVFADTGAEPARVYAWLDWLIERVPFPVYIVRYRDLAEDEGERRISKKSGNRYVKTGVPLWVWKDGKAGGALRRKCTRDYKINPVRAKVKKIAKIRRNTVGVCVQQWIGISTDEAHRMKPARDSWCENIWPLIDKMMSRKDCLAWMQRHGYPEPPRSSCVFCPFHSAEEWQRLQVQDPSGYQRAVAYEQKMSTAFQEHDTTLDADDVFCQKIVPGVSLSHIDWTKVVGTVQSSSSGEWGNECEGMCGL